MTHTDYIKIILNIKDNNINFYENCLEINNINNYQTKIFHGYLTYTPEYCPKCGCVNESYNDIIKWNWKRNCKIKMTKACGYNTLLILDKQRFYCKHCNKTFTASTDVVNFHKQISNETNLNITLELMEKGSDKDIAKRNNVSANHVNRILDKISQDKLVKNYGTLPKAMGIDEFNATKDTKSKMAFIVVDQNNHNIFDINNSRLSIDIEKYFKRYSRQERDKVQFITMDLYKPYYKLMHSLFKQATLISDRFHVVIQSRNALDNTRVKLCNKNNPNHKKLKKYWKLILKKECDLDDEKKKALKTFNELEKYILNSLDYEYSNGIVEGTNNVIKQIKHAACGYKKFKHLKARVMLIKGLYNPIKQN